MAPAKERPATKTIATNREARHEYFVLEALETGLELKGTEVKSLRAGGVNLKDSWVDIEDGELLVKGMHITPYDHGNIFNQDPSSTISRPLSMTMPTSLSVPRDSAFSRDRKSVV